MSSPDKVLRNFILIGKEVLNDITNLLIELSKALNEHKSNKNYEECLKLLKENDRENKTSAIFSPPENKAGDFEKALKINKVPFFPLKSSVTEQTVYVIPNEYIDKAQAVYDNLDLKSKSTLINASDIPQNNKAEFLTKNDPAFLKAFDDLAASNNLSYSRETNSSNVKIFFNKTDEELFKKTLYNATLLQSTCLNQALTAEYEFENNTFDKMKDAFNNKEDFYMVSMSTPNNYIHITPDRQCEIVVDNSTKVVDLSKSEHPIEELYSTINENLSFNTSTIIEANNIKDKDKIIAEKVQSLTFSIDDNTLSVQKDVINVLNNNDCPSIAQNDVVSLAKNEISLNEYFGIDESNPLYQRFEEIDSNQDQKAIAVQLLSEVSEKYVYDNDLEVSQQSIEFEKEDISTEEIG